MKLNGKIILRGVGLHSGNECELIIEPDASASEIIMCSDGNENGLPLKNFALNGTNRGSDYIFPDGTAIRTCEHVFSALNGMGIYSGVKLTVKGGEMPALDGCAKKLCDEILAHSDGIFEFEPDKIDAMTISEPVEIKSENGERKIAAFPCKGFHVTYTVEYDFVGVQTFDYEHSPENYYKNIAAARTFAMASDIEYLRSHGMALGGSLDNAIVVGEKIHASGGLRWKDEFVRHKILDLIGDMAAVGSGKTLNAHIIALRAGHELHLKLAEKLRKLII